MITAQGLIGNEKDQKKAYFWLKNDTSTNQCIYKVKNLQKRLKIRF
jgi:hypothetical protein